MLYKYDDCPLYTNKDREAAIEFIQMYLTENNKTNDIHAETDNPIIQNLTDPDLLKESVIKSYGINVITMANMLSVQNMYMTRYKDSLIAYLNYCNQPAYSSTMQMALLTPFAIFNMMRKSRFKPIACWSPNEKWTDFSMTDDVTRNILNPANIFYTSNLVIKNADRKMVDFLAKATRLQNLDTFPTDRTMDLNIRMIPSYHPAPILEIIKALHTYF